MSGDEALGDSNSGLERSPSLGALPSYVHTATDLSHLAEKRKTDWVKWSAENGVLEKDALAPFHSILGINWSPVKINAHGTFEQRGMDMNRLPLLLSVSALIQTSLKHIQGGHLKVVSHDSAKAEPFRIDEKNKTLSIAPDTYVRNHLQKLSVYEGLANDERQQYCKRAVSLAKLLGGEKIEPLLKPLTAMLSERQTASDKILAQAKALGYKDKRKALPQSIASDIALARAKQMFEDTVLLGEMIEANNRLSV